MQVVGREAFAAFLQVPVGRPDRFDQQRHLGLSRGAPAFFEVARRAGGGDVFP